MVDHVADSVIDNGLASLKSAARYVYLCTTEPTSYVEASSTYAKALKDCGSGNVFPNPIAAATGGRKLDTLNVSDGKRDWRCHSGLLGDHRRLRGQRDAVAASQ